MSVPKFVIRDVVSVVTTFFNNKRSFQRADRPSSALCLKTAGRSIYTQNGRQYCSDCTHLLLIPKGATYSFVIEEFGKCVMIEFEGENLPDTIQSYAIGDGNILKNIAFNSQYAWNFKRAGYRELCMSNMYQLLYQAVLYESKAYITNTQQARIEKSMMYMSEHCCDHTLTMEEVASQSDISEIYFRKLFTAIYGMPPKKYLIRMRINQAKELLRLRNSPVEKISECVGFGDVYSFSKAFRREVGCSPTEYRKKREIV